MDKSTKFNLPLEFIQAAEAEVGSLVTWMSFVFVDSEPNDNNQGIPQQAFASLIATGSLMPIKMEEGRIGGHPHSIPLGVIKQLEAKDNQIIGRAALWNEERPADIALLRENHSEGMPLDISFEVKFTTADVDNHGVEWLLDPIVKGATIVQNPAYVGRTPILSIASDDENSDMPDSCFAFIEPNGTEKAGFTSPRKFRHFPYRDVEGKISEIHLTQSLAEVEKIDFGQKERVQSVLQSAYLELKKEQQNQMDEKIKELEESQATLRKQIEDLTSDVEALTTERNELTEYKELREREDAEATLLKKRLSILSEAGFEFDEEQISERRSFWVGFDDEAFSSYVTHITEVRESKAEIKNPKIPDLSSDASNKNNVEILRKHFLKNKRE